MKCRPRGEGVPETPPDEVTPGARLVAALESCITKIGVENFPARVQKVKCLGGCNHACAVAVAQVGKTTYMYGNLSAEAGQIDDTIAHIEIYMRQYATSKNGYVPPLEKPEIFRGVLIRIPDPAWISEDGVVTPPISPAAGAAAPKEMVRPDARLRRAGEDA